MYGRDVTPNTHALAEQFVTLDHFFASGGNSADGHQWLTQANETEYPMWPLYYGRSYPSEGIDALTYSSGGFLWEAARAKSKTVDRLRRVRAGAQSLVATRVRRAMLAQYIERPTDFALHREMLKKRYNTHSDIPSLDRELVREYPGWTQEVPDVMKAGDILAHSREWEATRDDAESRDGDSPERSHGGDVAGWCTPQACVADNDFGARQDRRRACRTRRSGRTWRFSSSRTTRRTASTTSTAIARWRSRSRRTRGAASSTRRSTAQPSMVKTIELMLGLPAMSIFDLVATDMRASFIDAGRAPDLAPYTALEPQAIAARRESRRRASIKAASRRERRDGGAWRRRAWCSTARTKRRPSKLNRILWHDARGWDKMPIRR